MHQPHDRTARRHRPQKGGSNEEGHRARRSLLLCTALAAGAAQAGKARPNVVKLKFATYVWQPTTVAANKNDRRRWNKTHPAIQVEIVPVDVNSVHDKLLTSFVGGTAADIIHDEAADIAGFTQQGYLANLTPLLPKSLKQSIPKEIWATIELRRQDHRRPVAAADLQHLREHGHPQGGGDQGADARESVDVGAVPRQREEADELRQLRRLLGPPLADGRDPDDVAQLRRPVLLPRERQVDVQVRPERPERRHADARHDPRRQVGRPGRDGLSGSAVLPAFFGGKCAMTVPGNFTAQGMILQGPKGFNWAMFPLLKGQTQQQVANPQTLLDLAAEQEQAVGDVLPRLPRQQAEPGQARAGRLADPVEPGRRQAGRKSTKRTGSWTVATASVVHFRKGNWVSLAAYPRWKAEVAQPAFVQYLRAIELRGAGQAAQRRLDAIRGDEERAAQPAGRRAGRLGCDRESRMRT